MAKETTPYRKQLPRPRSAWVDLNYKADEEDDALPHRDGALLRLPRHGGQLPRRCVRCNRKAPHHTIEERLYPQKMRGLDVAQLASWLVSTDVTRVRASLCAKHMRERWITKGLLVTVLLAGVALIVGGMFAGWPMGMLLGVVLGVVASLAWLRGAVKLARANQRYVWLEVDDRFLRSIKRTPRSLMSR